MNKKIFNRIKFLLLTVSTVFISFQSGCGGSSPDIVKYKSELNTQMDAMLNTLNSNDYAKFIRDYVDPFYITKSGGTDSLLVDFNSSEQVKIFTTLQLAKNVEPVFNSTKLVMTYLGGSLTSPLTFLQLDGKWYLSGDSYSNIVK